MKKLLLIFLLVVQFHKAESQVVFCPPGAEWHYSIRVEAFFNPWLIWRNEQITYTNDSIVDNTTVKVLQHLRFFKQNSYGTAGSIPGTIIKQRGDTVFFRNATTQHAWQILYNFAVSPGQSWSNTITQIPVLTPSLPITTNYTITVDSVRSVLVNSFNLRRLYARYEATVYKFYNSLTFNVDTVCIDERMGCSQFLFNFYNRFWTSDYREYFNGFLCYKDNDFGSKRFTELPCTYTDAVGLRENNYSDSNMRVYPNPTNGILNVSSADETGNLSLIVTDLVGRQLKEEKLNSEQQQIQINDLSAGLYLLTVTKNKNIICQVKVFKQD